MPGFDRSAIVGITDRDLDEFICGICHEIFNTPVVTQCCRQTYCKSCIDEWLSTHNTCPNDRKPLTRFMMVPAPMLVLNLLGNMRIKCEYQDKGCKVITTIDEMAKHLEECNHKPNNSCKTCGLLKLEDEDHNCVSNLVIRNNSIVDEMARLREENQELKRYIDNQSALGMSRVLESARSSINNFVVEKTRDITEDQIRFLIDKCKESVMTKDSFWTISVDLYREVNKAQICKGTKLWQAAAFYLDGGESAAQCQQLFRIRFENLVIKLFTERDSANNKDNTI